MNPALVELAITEAPALIARLKELFASANPSEPQPTSEQVIAAYNAAFASSLASDNAWLTAHGLMPVAPSTAP